MKNFFITAVFLFFSPMIYADEDCSQLHDITFKIMKMRQWNISIVDQMNTIEEMRKVNPKNTAMHKLLQEIVISAYEEPRFNTEEYQEKAAKDFANNWTASCYKHKGKK